jgi:2-amino-4-hydroxy-6-hydroxymethyldihydropteridine diphosphokinase
LTPSLYLIALGSNQKHQLIGQPRHILENAIAALEMPDIDVFATSGITETAPMGPSLRRYANSAAIITTVLMPDQLLERLHQIEAHFGRQRRGQRWRSRTLDLDIILWSGGIWASQRLVVPHTAFRNRPFVLTPALEIAAVWRDPISSFTIRHLFHRQNRAKPLDQPEKRL